MNLTIVLKENTMMYVKAISLIAILVMLVSPGSAQDSQVDRVTVPLTDPNRAVMLKIGLVTGSISVKAYSGKDVVVEIKQQPDDENAKQERTRGGLRLIPNTSAGLTVEEEDNVVTVGTGGRGIHRKKQLSIQVPSNTSVKLSTVNDGTIDVEGISGEIEVNNVNGPVYLKNVSGSAVAHALNDDLVVNFLSVTPNKAMSFSSLNGKIDITFPSSLKATVILKSEQGDIYTDFDIAMEKSAARIEQDSRGKRKKVVLDKGMRGTINGGGAEILFTNHNGDIYIRKGK
jgi:hypothetical protein